jgi:Tol biopolymer transport system component
MNIDGSDQRPLNNGQSSAKHQSTWHPDGTKLIVGDNSGWNSGFYILYLDGSAPTKLTDDDMWGVWSPDGSQILTGGFDVMNADGSNKVRLRDGGSTPRWSPDGNKITFSLNGDIWLMNTDGSNETNLTEGNCRFLQGNSSSFCNSPSWSPDGTKIVFDGLTQDGTVGWSTGDGTPQKEIYMINADGSNFVRLTEKGSQCDPLTVVDGPTTTLNQCWSNTLPHWGPAAP